MTLGVITISQNIPRIGLSTAIKKYLVRDRTSHPRGGVCTLAIAGMVLPNSATSLRVKSPPYFTPPGDPVHQGPTRSSRLPQGRHYYGHHCHPRDFRLIDNKVGFGIL